MKNKVYVSENFNNICFWLVLLIPILFKRNIEHCSTIIDAFQYFEMQEYSHVCIYGSTCNQKLINCV